MNRVYLMPKIIILTFIFLYVFEIFYWLHILLALLGSTIILLVFEVIMLYSIGKYYLHLLKKGKEVPKKRIFTTINRFLKTVNHILRMDITVSHLERFNPEKHYLITPNHQSNADATIMLEVFKDPIVFVAKIAIAKLPIIRDWMKLIGSLYLNKDDMRSQIKIMQEVEYKINNHESVLIFPEGRRSFSAVMNEFKPGTFKMATKTKVDILPITINHAHKLRHHFPWRKTNVEVYFHEPIPYEVYKDMGTQEIAAMVHKIVEAKVIY